MESKKKILLSIIGVAILVVAATGVTLAFFNYTRTGTANTVSTGRIAFNSSQDGRINLTNVFPIDPTETGIMDDNTKVGTVTINVTGDTTYDNGVEYLVSATNVTNTVGTKAVPISIIAEASGTLGTSDEDYFDNRDTATNHIYKVLAKDTISNNDQLMVGYIAKGATGINGTITIKAYIDKNKVAITDTYNSNGTPTDTNGTTSEWVNGREVFTTTEWNSLVTNGISFQIRVEANEGIWVPDPNARPVNACTFDVSTVNVTTYDINKEACMNAFGDDEITEQICSGQTVYVEALGGNYDFDKIILMFGMTLEQAEEQGLISNVRTKHATELVKGIEYVNGQYTYSYINNGWHVELTDKESIEPVTTTLCTKVNNYPITDMYGMFATGQATSIDLSSFDTSNVTNMSNMFAESQATSLDLSSFDTSNVTDMSYMFGGSQATSLDLSSFDTSNVTNMTHMFNYNNATSLDLSSFDTSNVTNMSVMFAGSQATSIDLSSFDTSNVTDMNNMFSGANVTTIYVSNLWNNTNNHLHMFDAIYDDNNNATYPVNIVGGYIENPTRWNINNPTDSTYAHVDGGPSNPGYFTYKAAPNN